MNTTAASTAAGTATLQLEYLSSEQIACQSSLVVARRPGRSRDSRKRRTIEAVRIPVAASMTPALLAARTIICEVWRVAEARRPIVQRRERQGHVRYRYCDDLLFGSLDIAEQRDEDEARALLRATETAYQEIFDVLNRNRTSAPDPHLELSARDQSSKSAAMNAIGIFNSARQMAFRKFGPRDHG